MFIIIHRKIFYIISGILVLASIIFLLVWGLRFGIDFTGGAILEVRFIGERPATEEIQKRLDAIGFGSAIIQFTGEKGALLRMRAISERDHQHIRNALGTGAEELRFDSIGPVIGKEIQRKSIIALVLVLVMILLFITWSFRKVSRLVSSWKCGIIAIVALVHDIIIPSGLFSVLGQFWHVEVGTLFVTALLTILGFSVYDTIVVFDRIRENSIKIGSAMSFNDIVGKSLDEVKGRSFSTSFAIFIVLLFLFLFGEASTKFFSLALLVGGISGAYSSIFLASPLLVSWQKWSSRNK